MQQSFDCIKLHFSTPLLLSRGREQFDESAKTLHSDTRALALFTAALLMGASYSISRSELEVGYPGLPPGLSGLPDVIRDEEAVLGRLELMVGFNHESGFYAQWASVFHHQQTVASALEMPDESFWQHDVWVGYRFPRRRAEIRLGVLNLMDEDFRLNPLNEYRPIPRERTFEAALRINF